MKVRNLFTVAAAVPLAAVLVGVSAPGVSNAGCGGAITPWGASTATVTSGQTARTTTA